MTRTLAAVMMVLAALVAAARAQEAAGPDLDYSEPGVASEECLCVPFYQCVDGEIVDDGSNIIDPRKKPQAEEVPLAEGYTAPECGPYHVCCRNPEASTVRPYEHACGRRNPGGITGRILTPHAAGESEFGEWPWQAAVLKREGSELVFKCGGTLIDERHVLTVAHCVDQLAEDSLLVRLGEWDTQNEDELQPHEDFKVEEVMVHPEFKSNNLFNDLAVLRLDSEVQFKPHVDSVCLPKREDDFTGQECVVTGWGTNAYKSGAFSMVMKEVSLPVVGHDECQTALRKTRLGRFFRLHRGFLCAGGQEGQDSCKGDGGGPLVCFKPESASYAVAGLVAWGIDCGQPGVPGVYVNVSKYVDWIASKTGKQPDAYWPTA